MAKEMNITKLILFALLISFQFSCSSFDELIDDNSIKESNFIKSKATNVEDACSLIKMRPISIAWHNEEESKDNKTIDKITYIEELQIKSWIRNRTYWVQWKGKQYLHEEHEYFFTPLTEYQKSKTDIELNDGKVVKTDYYRYEYAEGNLTKIIGFEKYLVKPVETLFTWNNGLLTEIVKIHSLDDHFLQHQYEIEYTEYPCQIWTPLYIIYEDFFSRNSDKFVIMQGLLGNIPKYFIASITESLSGDTDRYRGGYTLKTTTFKYELNEYGYPIKVVKHIIADNGKNYEENMLIEWEEYE